MTTVVQRIRSDTELPVGVSVLRNDALSALGISVATGAQFIRVNVLSGVYATDQGLIEGVGDELMRARRSLGDPVAVLADVRVKHAAPLVERPLDVEVSDLCDRGLADAVVVTGRATGVPPGAEVVRRVVEAAREVPVLVGSGVTPDVLRAIAAPVRGAIVATWTRVAGRIARDRVSLLKEVLAGQE